MVEDNDKDLSLELLILGQSRTKGTVGASIFHTHRKTDAEIRKRDIVDRSK
jgi:hypothetical protein